MSTRWGPFGLPKSVGNPEARNQPVRRKGSRTCAVPRLYRRGLRTVLFRLRRCRTDEITAAVRPLLLGFSIGDRLVDGEAVYVCRGPELAPADRGARMDSEVPYKGGDKSRPNLRKRSHCEAAKSLGCQVHPLTRCGCCIIHQLQTKGEFHLPIVIFHVIFSQRLQKTRQGSRAYPH